MNGSAEVTVVPQSITVRQRSAFDPDQVALIRAMCMPPDATQGEMAVFLETCARHELDPLIKEVWAIRLKRGAAVQTIVAKDGLLKIASRCTGKGWANQPGEFLGVTSGAVHAHDLYEVDRFQRDDGTTGVMVKHKGRNASGDFVFGGRDMSERGPLIGSWAICRRRGHDDQFFEAPRHEYDKAINAWLSHPHAMMVKCAEAVVLRKSFSIAGVVGEGEVDRVVDATAVEDATGGDIIWPQDDTLTEDLTVAFRTLGYRRAKVRALVNACADDAGFHALLDRLHAEIGEVAAPPEPDDVDEAEVVG